MKVYTNNKIQIDPKQIYKTTSGALESFQLLTPKHRLEAAGSSHNICELIKRGQSEGDLNQFIKTLNTAYDCHLPIVLSPDIFWLCLAQSFATYLKINSEKYRGRFVQHEGKEKLNVRRDDFVKGSKDNAWTEVFSEFSNQIKDRIGSANHSKLVPKFSTTTEIETAVFEVTLLDQMQNYFEYHV